MRVHYLPLTISTVCRSSQDRKQAKKISYLAHAYFLRSHILGHFDDARNFLGYGRRLSGYLLAPIGHSWKAPHLSWKGAEVFPIEIESLTKGSAQNTAAVACLPPMN